MSVLTRLRKGLLVRHLTRLDPDRLEEKSGERAVRAFHRACRTVTAYRDMMLRAQSAPRGIRTLRDFRERVPVIQKDFFSGNRLRSLCRTGTFSDVGSVMVSSGAGGNGYSFGLISRKECRSFARKAGVLLDLWFDTSRRKTMLINALAMGTHIDTDLTTAATSVRPDSVLELVRRLRDDFDQFILIGNAFFAKQVLEQGIDEGIDWSTVSMHLILGEDWFPEEYRSYLYRLLERSPHEPGGSLILSNMGTCELGLSLFMESAETVRLRRAFLRDPDALRSVYGAGSDVCPLLFQYDPTRIFVEDMDGELVFTRLAAAAPVPLVRYRTGDRGSVHGHTEFCDLLRRAGLGDMIPKLRLPFVSLWGRAGNGIAVAGGTVTPEHVKSSIYRSDELAASITGNFRMSPDDGGMRIKIQLKPGKELSARLTALVTDRLARDIAAPVSIELYAYRDYPHGVELNYEWKFRYV